MPTDVKEYEQFLARRCPFIQHAQEVVLQSGARLIFAGAGRGSAKSEAIKSMGAVWFHEAAEDDGWAYRTMSWWLQGPEHEIRNAVVLNLGIEPKDEVYLTIKRLVGPKQSTFFTADFSQLEKRVLAYYYGMSDDKFWKEYGQDLAGVPGSVTRRFAGGSRSNFYDSLKRMDPDADGLRRGRFESMCTVTGRFPSQNPPESKGLYPYKSGLRKLPPLD